MCQPDTHETIPHEIAHHVASQTNQTVFLFDTNKDASVSALHMLSKLAGYSVPYRWMEKKDPDRLESAKAVLDTLPIFVGSKAGMNIGWIKSTLERGCKDAWLPPGLFIVDSIQGMDEAESPENGFDRVMRQLKEIADRYNVAVIVTTDLKQNLDRRKDTRPYHLACPTLPCTNWRTLFCMSTTRPLIIQKRRASLLS